MGDQIISGLDVVFKNFHHRMGAAVA